MEPVARVLARDRLVRVLSKLVLSNYMHKLDTLKVLDVGCGNGYILREMPNLGVKPENCYGVDIDEPLLIEADQKSPATMNYFCQPLDTLADSQGKFDIVITSGFFAYFTNEEVQRHSQIIRGMMAPGASMISSNYDTDWVQAKGGQLHPLSLRQDGIRAFDFAKNELNTLLSNEFKHFVRYPHALGGFKFSKFLEMLESPKGYSSYECMLDSEAVKATSFLDIYLQA